MTDDEMIRFVRIAAEGRDPTVILTSQIFVAVGSWVMAEKARGVTIDWSLIDRVLDELLDQQMTQLPETATP